MQDSERGGVLTYAAGYICRHLLKTEIRKRKPQIFKEEMVLCLMDMVEDPKIVRDKMKLMSNGLN